MNAIRVAADFARAKMTDQVATELARWTSEQALT
jgi:hypothetical protein